MPALEGIKIVDLTEYLSGPYCTMMLADLGADVIKIEEPGRGDGSRQWGPPFLGGESAYFLSVNRNKRSLALNLKSEQGREVLTKLVSESDVLIENFRPGIAETLGIDYEELRKTNPGLIYCSISGFGQEGPYRNRPSYDIVGQAMSGLMSITGEKDGGPVKVGIAIADICAGMFATIGILAALTARNTTGVGQRIDISLLDGLVSWLSHQAGYYFATAKNPERLGTAHPTIAPYQAFRASDGFYFVLAVGNDSIWARFCNAVGIDALASDSRFVKNSDRVKNREQLVSMLENLFSKKTRAEWLEIINAGGVPCAPILTLSQVFQDPQVLFRQMVEEVSHMKAGKIRVVASPVKMSDSPFSVRFPPPLLGESTEEILSSLGYSTEQIKKFKNAKVV
ncbi:MAG TPA: CoA transferase [Nitrososphaerales archaeon]|nr:CoA transferase [Nitrososphaerales archaeon]